MFKAGDRMNPYDPASLAFPNEWNRDLPEMFRRLPAAAAGMFSDPEKMAWFTERLRERDAELVQSGETYYDRMVREKREWAEMDAKSAKLKDEGNAAFKNGDLKTAYIVYTVCMGLSCHEPLYPLNRAAVALKLKLYDLVVEDASAAIERGDFNRVKAYFRRAQGWRFLGEWGKADEDYTRALELQPDDLNILREVEELKKLRGLSPGDRAKWISAHAKVTLLDVFKPGELKRRTEEVRIRSLK
ncbi:TPR-like protein [Mycena vulgaris]|nr:TPR-like protein [Mycena vulgaris]